MIIKEITLHAFGKFSHKKITFEDGLNIIEGFNEAGKSTIHKFIECMFYGFYRGYTKNKLYEIEYDLFNPWDHSGYSGTLTFEDEGQRIRLERQFTKGKDSLKIIDDITGQDLTETYDYNKVIKQADPTKQHIGFNKTTYQNTISLTQMKSKTDEELVKEIKDNMSNLASSHQATISVEGVIDRLDKKENAIGSMKKKTSSYYKLNEEIKELKANLVLAKEVQQQIVEEKMKENSLLDDIESVKMKSKKIKKHLAYLDYQEDKEILKKVKLLLTELLEFENKLLVDVKYKDFDGLVASQLQMSFEQLEVLERELLQADEKIADCHKSIEAFDLKIGPADDISGMTLVFEKVNKLIHEYEQEESLLNLKKQELQQISIQKDLVRFSKPPKTFITGWIISPVIGFLGIFLSIIGNPIGYGLVVLALLIGAFLGVKRHNGLQTYKAYQHKMGIMDTQIATSNQQVLVVQKKLQNILNEAQVDDLYSLKVKRDQYLSGLSVANTKATTQLDLGNQKLQKEEQLKSLELMKERLRRQYESSKIESHMLMEPYGIQSKNQIQEALERHHNYKGHMTSIGQLKERIKEQLGNRTLEALETQVSNGEGLEAYELVDPNVLEEALEEVSTTLLRLTEEIGITHTKISNLVKSTRSVPELEEIIAQKEGIQEQQDFDLKVIDTIKIAIDTIATDIQNNFAPQLNLSMSEVVKKVTNGKYTNIKVNPSMNLTIMDESSHKTVGVESLSAGTIDLLYFGLRLGIADVLSSGKTLPLILDDAFVQYDDGRLKNVLTLLAKNQRQVLLFTCHERETRLLDSEELTYHRISL